MGNYQCMGVAETGYRVLWVHGREDGRVSALRAVGAKDER